MNNNLPKAAINRLNKEKLEFDYNKEKNIIEFKYNNNKYGMSVDNFPFRPPLKFSVNNKIVNYQEMSINIQNILSDVFNIKCLCCISIFCPNTWHLSFKFMDIVNEYEKFTGIINAAHNYKLLKDKGILNSLPKEINEEILKFLRFKCDA
jgi:hypothetical protein